MIKQKIKGEVYTIRRIVNNLNRYMEIATPEEIEVGKSWYNEANQFCRRVGEQYGITLEQAAGLTSVFSPQTSWTVNKQLVKSFMDSKGKSKVTTMDRVLKARRMLKTTDYQEIMDLLSVHANGSKKTKAFYDSICRPTETDLVVIDRHQIAASFQRPDATAALDASLAQITSIQYDFLSECTREAARKFNMNYTACQATIWTVYRRCRNLFEHKQDALDLPGYMEETPF